MTPHLGISVVKEMADLLSSSSGSPVTSVRRFFQASGKKRGKKTQNPVLEKIGVFSVQNANTACDKTLFIFFTERSSGGKGKKKGAKGKDGKKKKGSPKKKAKSEESVESDSDDSDEDEKVKDE